MDSFIFWPFMGALSLSAITAPLGCLVVWRRLSFIGDTLAHSALGALLLSFILNLPPLLGIIGVGASVILFLAKRNNIPQDLLLNIMTQGFLSFGVVLYYFARQHGMIPPVDLSSLLFGDLLTMTSTNVWNIFSLGVLILMGLWLTWDSLIFITLNEEWAAAEGLKVKFYNFLFYSFLVLIIAFALKMVGVLLLSSLLTLPAFAVRNFSSSPEKMVIYGTILSLFATSLGFYASFALDLPTGPTIACVLVSAGIIGRWLPGTDSNR